MRCLWEYDEVGFIESKPPQISKSLYCYHLNQLVEQEVIKKIKSKYTLTKRGKNYVEGIFSDKSSKKIDLKILVHNNKGEIKIISGRLLDTDPRTHAAAVRIVQKKLTCQNPNLEHLGDAYIKIYDKRGKVTEHTFSHIFELKNAVNTAKIREYLLKEIKEEILFVKNNAEGHFFFERDYLMD
jgi:hypothetical protein